MYIFVKLQLKEVDLALGPFAIELQRYEAIDFAGYLTGSGSSILIRYPSQIYISAYATIEPFSFIVYK